MAVPDFQSFFRPLLEYLSDGKERTMMEARNALAVSMQMSEVDLKEMLPSGIQTKFDNRVAWAKSYLKQAGAIESPRRARFNISERGRGLLRDHPGRIDVKVLNKFPEFLEFHSSKGRSKAQASPESANQATEQTPEETLQEAYESIRESLAAEILDRISKNSPGFFENLVVDLMMSLGYGGSRAEAGKAIGQSGDEGIDGIINEDKLGLDVIYLQAKRWVSAPVGRPEVQKFVGALHGKRAKKGVFITIGKFTEDAKRYVETIDPKVILIDGITLANLMIEHNLGVATKVSYSLKRIDGDYFDEE